MPDRMPRRHHVRRLRRARASRAADGAVERGLAGLADAQRRAIRRRACDTVRAVHEERLRRTEQDLVELRGRVNGLIFLAVGTVVAQVIVRLLG
jgi:hypothetical protein